MTKNRWTVTASAVALLVTQLSWGATIPAGTTLVVRTVDTISLQDRVGRIFAARLDQDLRVHGKVVAPAGTTLFGRIDQSRAKQHPSSPLTLNLISISIGGKKVPLKTEGGFEVNEKAVQGRQTRRGVRVGSYILPAGTKMEFRLSQPVSL
jgi:hypothetical protein